MRTNQKHRPKTTRAYKAIVERYLSSGLGADEYLKAMSEEFKPSTYSLHLIVLRNHFADCLSKGAISENPFAHYKAISATTDEQEDGLPLSQNEIHRLTEAVISRQFGLRDSAIIGLLFFSCMRVSEVAMLESIDVLQSTLVFRNANEKKTIRSLGPHMRELLVDYLNERQSHPGKKKSGSLFGLSLRGIQDMTNRAFSTLGIKRPRISADSLRTAFSVIASTAGTHSIDEKHQDWEGRVAGIYLAEAVRATHPPTRIGTTTEQPHESEP